VQHPISRKIIVIVFLRLSLYYSLRVIYKLILIKESQLNLTTPGLKTRIQQWLKPVKQFFEMFSTSKDVYGDLLGVDLDDSSILSILLRNPLGSVRVYRADMVELSSGIISDDVITDNNGVSAAIKKMLKKAGIDTSNAAIAMPGSKVVIKKIKLDVMLSEADAEARAWQEARKTFPEIVKNLYLDFSQIEDPDIHRNKKYILVLIAVRKEDITPRVDALQQAGLTTKIVDVDFYALQRCYPLLALQLPPDHANKYVTIIDFNPHSIVFLVMYQKTMVYSNRQTYTGDVLVPLKSKPTILPSLRNIPMQIPFPGEKNDSESEVEFEKPVIPESLTNEQKSHVVMSIRRLFQSFYSENPGCAIHYVVMTGRCALIPELTQHIEKMLDIPLIIGNPLQNIKMSEGVDAEKLMALGPAFALSCGLAMRGVPIWI
jgi:type IV pilus assembly protein PilM